MIKPGVSLKIVVLYASVIAVLALSVWLVYSNTRAFAQMDKAGREYVVRRDVADSLVYCFLQMNNSERAICLGNTAEWEVFDSILGRTLALADTLAVYAGDSLMHEKTDSLRTLLMMKRANTLQIIREMADADNDAFFRKKVSDLQRGNDSVVIHPKTLSVKEEKEVVYDVVRSKKGFFARLADVFRRQRSDTVAVSERRSKAVADSARHGINIADTVAGVLEEIKREERESRRAKMRGHERRANEQQLVGIRLAGGISGLLEDIRHDERARFKAALDADMAGRRGVLLKIVLLAISAVLSAGVLIYHVLKDIRRGRMYNENLRQAKAETERIMAQRERLLLTITHDIKAPAASISGFIELLAGHVSGGKAASYLDNIKSSATHLLGLVGSLLDYHKLESGKAETRKSSFSPARLIEGCVEGIMPQAGAKGLSVSCDTSGCGTDFCRADAFRIKQVADNLLSNALKYTREGGISVSAAMQGGFLSVDVGDTGCGMSPADVHRIFNAFTRLPDAQGTEGVGLGLSIVKETVNLLGGRITVESEKGRGTVFHVSLPVEPSAAPQPSCAPAGPVAGGTEPPVLQPVAPADILVLDDDRLQLHLLGEMLARLSGGKWRVTACNRAGDALRRLGEARPDVFFIDIEMPGVSGVDIAGGITDRRGMRLIAMTAHDPSIEPRLMEAGFDACLFKPFSMERLSSVLAGISGHGGAPQDVPVAAGGYGRFSTLLAYADGDAGAEHEILSGFAAELASHVGNLRYAMERGDRGAIGRVAHKALPLLKMTCSAATGPVEALLPGHIGQLDDAAVASFCKEAMRGMEEDRASAVAMAGSVQGG